MNIQKFQLMPYFTRPYIARDPAEHVSGLPLTYAGPARVHDEKYLHNIIYI